MEKFTFENGNFLEFYFDALSDTYFAYSSLGSFKYLSKTEINELKLKLSEM